MSEEAASHEDLIEWLEGNLDAVKAERERQKEIAGEAIYHMRKYKKALEWAVQSVRLIENDGDAEEVAQELEQALKEGER